ncbi:hypothetical protein M2132_001752 [Dysgonomonas sp. PH5-45]|uniref:hypothetical protein n=1 Tax=unclassified Dysgonomonas TaxID=2630389 RepID=UPI002476F3F4|nr:MULTISPECIES: hypothetical protein [unclassified Dysgonomonas]MDH6355410.1 hypothetical protein [Dysgonomonas sp. PH5-45]MDH6388307.1 hypothetical protein [Dysgonomonas sp. PH5-37]
MIVKHLIGYLFSQNKNTYKELAKIFKVYPYHVYALAHGRKAKTYNEFNILQELVNRKIVDGYQLRYK